MLISYGTRASRFSNVPNVFLLPVIALLFLCGVDIPSSHAQSSYYSVSVADGLTKMSRDQWSRVEADARQSTPGYAVQSVDDFIKMNEYYDRFLADGTAVHSFKTARNETIQCIDIRTQQSVISSGGDPNNIPRGPSSAPALAPTDGQTAPQGNLSGLAARQGLDGTRDEAGNERACPEGSFPKLIFARENLYRFKSFEDIFRKLPVVMQPVPDGLSVSPQASRHEYAHAARTLANKGLSANFNLWNPTVASSAEFSLSQLWVARGSGTDLQTAETGWQVYNGLYGDNQARLFIYGTSDGYSNSGNASSGCYNLTCGRFVQTNSSAVIGGSFTNYSTTGGSQYQVTLAFIRDDGGSHHWWLYVGGTAIGYYPNSLYDTAGLANQNDSLDFGGEIVNNLYGSGDTSTDMGSGAYASAGFGQAAYINSIRYVDMSYVWQNASGLGTYTTNSNLWSISSVTTSSDANWLTYFYFGGPGSGGGGGGGAPPAPVATAATGVLCDYFAARWNASSGATGYQFDLSNFSNFSNVQTSYLGNITAIGISASPDTVYYYRVRASNSSGVSGNSNTIGVATSALSAAPSAPTATAATGLGSTGFNATWTGTNSSTAIYLDVSTNSNFSSFVPGYNGLNVGYGSTSSYSISGLNPSTTYYYRVRYALNCSQTSANSNTIAVTTPATPAPPSPAASAATNITSTSFTANWGSASGATGYRIDVSADSSFSSFVGSYNNLDVGNTLSTSVSGLSANTIYYYRVRAYNSAGTSPNSSPTAVTTFLAVTSYQLPFANSSPFNIVAGSDGAMWFTESSANRVGRITTSGTLSEFSVPSAGRGIVSGNDGALWIAAGAGLIQMTTAGAITYTTQPSSLSNVDVIGKGPDGNIWTNRYICSLVKWTTPNSRTDYDYSNTIPCGNSVGGIVAGPDGALWFGAASRVGRMTTTGTATSFLSSITSYRIVVGPDNALWYTTWDSAAIGRITTAGVITTFPTLTNTARTFGITVGPDGALWFAMQTSGKIGRITTAGVVTEYGVDGDPFDIALGPDGALWITMPNANKIVRYVPPTGPTITQNPSSQTVAAGQTATFTAAASGQPTPTVQWQSSSDGGGTYSNIAGAISTTLSFTATTGQNGYRYRAVFTNSGGSATTTGAVLTVGTSYTINLSASPSAGGTVAGGGSFPAGSSQTVTATANSGYQFQNWTELGNVVSSSASYTFTLQANRAFVANFTSTSGGNDNFASAITLSGSSGSTTGSNVGATKEAGEPNHAGNTGGASMWWQWTPVASGSVTINTIGSGFDTTLGIYTGSAVGTLTTIASDDDSGGNYTSSVTFNAVAGTTYRIAVDGYNGVTGNIVLAWNQTVSGGSLGVSPSTNIVSLGPVGGAFYPATFNYNLAASSGTVNWSITGLPDWLTASATSGSATTSGTTVTFSVNTAALSKSIGAYGPTTIAFTNTTNGQGNTSRTAGLTVSSIACEAMAKGPEFEGGAGAKGDILWRSDAGAIGIWFMNGVALSSGPGLGAVPTNWRIAATADFNGDGKSDILWRNTSTGETAVWFLSGVTVTGTASIATIPTDWKIVGAGDFNGDGKADLLWRQDTGAIGVWLLNNGTIQSSASLGAVATSWRIVGLGDFNGDGKLDLLWRAGDGTTAVWLMNGTAVTGTASLGVVPTDWRIAGVGDFNGDAKADILWRQNGGTVAMWFMNGTLLASSGTVGMIGSDWHIASTNDYNGDGKADLLWRQDGGTIGVWLMNGAATTATGGLSGIGTDWHIVNGEHDRPLALIQPGPC